MDKLQELGEAYASGELPPWVWHMMNASLLTPIIKAAAPPGVTPDMRPIVARETDIAVFDKVVNAAVVDEVNKKLRPQQLAVGEPMGCEKKIWTMKLLQQEAKQKPGGWAIMIALDQQNAFQELDKVAALAVMDQWAEDVPALAPLARLHRDSQWTCT